MNQQGPVVPAPSTDSLLDQRCWFILWFSRAEFNFLCCEWSAPYPCILPGWHQEGHRVGGYRCIFDLPEALQGFGEGILWNGTCAFVIQTVCSCIDFSSVQITYKAQASVCVSVEGTISDCALTLCCLSSKASCQTYCCRPSKGCPKFGTEDSLWSDWAAGQQNTLKGLLHRPQSEVRSEGYQAWC